MNQFASETQLRMETQKKMIEEYTKNLQIECMMRHLQPLGHLQILLVTQPLF